MIEHIFILRGQLHVGGYPGLAYQLTYSAGEKAGQPVEWERYSGDGHISADKVCFAPKGPYGPVYEFTLAQSPTEESVQYKAGYEFAQKQKRRCRPRGQRPEAFIQGWQAAWRERRPSAIYKMYVKEKP